MTSHSTHGPHRVNHETVTVGKGTLFRPPLDAVLTLGGTNESIACVVLRARRSPLFIDAADLHHSQQFNSTKVGPCCYAVITVAPARACRLELVRSTFFQYLHDGAEQPRLR